ncbi:MAG: hypothetical protein C4K60_14905 [Ideonella sp. MAG2]|nr:MAG: hypothetical protein C4K60_14905 [Ideonella sp. MAG2]
MMLPDLPLLKAELRDIYLRYVSRRAHSQLGVLSEAPRQVVHEGQLTRIERASGETEDIGMHKASVELSLGLEQAEAMPLQERLRVLNELADGMAAQMTDKLFTSLHETLDRAGQTVHNRGRPLDVQTLLQMLDLIELDFDSNGRPRFPVIQVGAAMAGAWERVFNQLQNDPTALAKLDQLLAEKKANWRDREAARKLVG